MERELGNGREETAGKGEKIGEIPKWEYLFVTITSFSGDAHQPHSLNFKNIKDSKKLDLADFSNQLGDQGWELVGSAGANMPNNLLIFKRPKMSEKPPEKI